MRKKSTLYQSKRQLHTYTTYANLAIKHIYSELKPKCAAQTQYTSDTGNVRDHNLNLDLIDPR